LVTILALAAAALYGSADFLGGVASRRASAFAVLAVTVPAGAAVMVAAGLVTGGWGAVATPSAAGWAAAAGACGALGLVAFYAAFAAAPMSVVAPVAALISTVLPVGIAVAEGERPTPGVAAGAVICIAAVVLVSLGQRPDDGAGGGPGHGLRGVGYAVCAGAAFGLFFLFLKNAGASGVIWPVAIARLAGAVVAFACCAVTRIRPLGWGRGRASRAVFGIALASGAVDAAANVCYVLATRAGLFGVVVVITSLYPGMTVLLARVVLGERMRWVQRAGLALAAAGLILVTA